ncbi:hypothetical protein MCOR23_001012 [Pyricularia oryzae]|nr:hypothetical protein MCOR23_001012 [Pyricularia oryzae]KAI6421364.1 hypothetical protein MCOR24_004310 [Pyricularia oryzae]
MTAPEDAPAQIDAQIRARSPAVREASSSSETGSVSDTVKAMDPCHAPDASIKRTTSSASQHPIPAAEPPTAVVGEAVGADATDEEAAVTPPKDHEKSTPPEAGRTKLETTVIVVSLATALFLAALDISIVTVAVPAIASDFRSTVGYTWIGSAYLLANAAMAPIWGKISDIWGRKQILLLAACVFWIGSLLCALSVSMAMLIASRAVQGMGGGGIIIMVNVCISDLFSIRKRGVYFGIMGLVWAVAGAVGPVVGGLFTTKVSWRWCFYINLPIAGVGIIILFFVLKLHNPRTPMRQGLAAVDWLGSLTIIAGTVMVLMGLTLGGVTAPWASPTVLCLLIIGAAMVAVFVLVELRVAPYPVVPMHLFKVRSNVASLSVAFAHGFTTMSGFYYLPLYFQAVLGADALMSGVYILPYAVVLSLVSVAAGCYIKKTGKYLPPIIFGFVFLTLGMGLLTDLGGPSPSGPNWAKLMIYTIITGIGVGPNFQSPLIALQTTVAQRDMASATATYQFVRQMSTSISVVVGGVIFQNSMDGQHARLLERLGPDIAALLTGQDAAASVEAVAAIPGEEGLIARDAFWISLRTMYIVYTVAAGVGLVLCFFIGTRKLSTEHEEHKTGLKTLARVRSKVTGEKQEAD